MASVRNGVRCFLCHDSEGIEGLGAEIAARDKSPRRPLRLVGKPNSRIQSRRHLLLAVRHIALPYRHGSEHSLFKLSFWMCQNQHHLHNRGTDNTVHGRDFDVHSMEPSTSWGPISSERSFGNKVTQRVFWISGAFFPKYLSLSKPH